MRVFLRKEDNKVYGPTYTYFKAFALVGGKYEWVDNVLFDGKNCYLKDELDILTILKNVKFVLQIILTQSPSSKGINYD